jgi:hypothetical protein
MGRVRDGPEWRCTSSSSISQFDDEDEDEDENDHDVSFLFPIRPQADGPTEPRTPNPDIAGRPVPNGAKLRGYCHLNRNPNLNLNLPV